MAFLGHGSDILIDFEVALGAEKTDVVDHIDFLCSFLTGDAGFKNFGRGVGRAEWETNDGDGQDRGARQVSSDIGDHGGVDTDGGCVVLLSFGADG